jgi:hypothetical protein
VPLPNKKTYQTPAAFRVALEDRIRRAANAEHADISRARQILVFQRFLARLFQALGDAVVLKGGVALELRLQRARTTKDVDLRLTGDPSDIVERLQRAGRLDLGDYLTFHVEPDREHPTVAGDGVVYEGYRFRANAVLAGKLYGNPFGVDVGVADIMGPPAETVEGSPALDFIGVERPKFRIYPREVHIAEKLHAYTLPREKENSRVKDLPDLALLGTTGPMDGAELRTAMEATFSFRGTHALPPELPLPPSSPRWVLEYGRMAQENDLRWRTLPDIFAAAGSFLNPVLGGEDGTWDPQSWRWAPR